MKYPPIARRRGRSAQFFRTFLAGISILAARPSSWANADSSGGQLTGLEGVVTENPLLPSYSCKLTSSPNAGAVPAPSEPGSLDFDGDGVPDRLEFRSPGRTHQRSFLWSITTSLHGNVDVTLASSTFQNLDVVAAGDVNGDGFDDLIVKRSAAEFADDRGWTALLSRGDAAVPRAVEGLPDAAVQDERWFAADVDGDRLTDLIRTAPGGAPLLCRARSGPPIAGATVRILPSGASATTDALGTFRLPNVEVSATSLAASAPGYLFSRPVLPLTDQSRGKRPLRFVGTDTIGSPIPLSPEARGPYVCLGFNPQGVRGPDTPEWGISDRCPPGYAFYGLANTMQKAKRASEIIIAGDCCRLPADDVLLPETAVADDRCPEGSVATGAENGFVNGRGANRLICTKINLDRYRLGPITSGVFWGYDHSYLREKQSIAQRIPPAIRVGIGRASLNAWDQSGCIGAPPGALLVGVGVGDCTQLRFRELLYKVNEDGHGPVPVRMYPDCDDVENAYLPDSGCRKVPSNG